jgi:hypothetical protein
MDEERRPEASMEARVIAELRHCPLYALELARALGEDRREVAAAVERLQAGGAIAVPKRDARFQLV